MVSWEYYSRRRNTSLQDFMKFRNLETYEDYFSEMEKMQIIALSREEFEFKFVKKEPKVKKAEAKKAEAKKADPPVRKKRKYTRRKKQ